MQSWSIDGAMFCRGGVHMRCSLQLVSRATSVSVLRDCCLRGMPGIRPAWTTSKSREGIDSENGSCLSHCARLSPKCSNHLLGSSCKAYTLVRPACMLLFAYLYKQNCILASRNKYRSVYITQKHLPLGHRHCCTCSTSLQGTKCNAVVGSR